VLAFVVLVYADDVFLVVVIYQLVQVLEVVVQVSQLYYFHLFHDDVLMMLVHLRMMINKWKVLMKLKDDEEDQVMLLLIFDWMKMLVFVHIHHFDRNQSVADVLDVV
jgi:hypothetical protein